MSENGNDFRQPAHFVFTSENLAKAKAMIAKYPEGRAASALVPLLDLAQRQIGGEGKGWLSRAAMDVVAAMLGVPPARAYEVATFYTMFNLKPVGKYHVQLCRTTPCWLRGGEAIAEACCKKLGIQIGEVTADGKFSLQEVECLGACSNAPVVQINDDFYEDLTPEKMEALLEALRFDEKPAAGSQTGRKGACPEGGAAAPCEKHSEKEGD
jgi:NADH-quinone oxidoreductase E subunit